MKRLENIRTLRNQTNRNEKKTPYGAMMALAQLTQEKQRLGQERATWERRIQKIDHRLEEIAGLETPLLVLAGNAGLQASMKVSAANSLPGSGRDLPPGFTEVNLKY
jgi:hypothetical protein